MKFLAAATGNSQRDADISLPMSCYATNALENRFKVSGIACVQILVWTHLYREVLTDSIAFLQVSA